MSDNDDRPVLDQINRVVRDMDTMVAFSRRLGVEIAPARSWSGLETGSRLP